MKRICALLLFASVLLLLTPQVTLAEKKGADRPLKGSLEGFGQLFFDEKSVCFPGPVTITIASGNLSHLGLVSARFSHCPAPPGSGLPFTNGTLILIAANGDELRGTYEDADGLPPFIINLINGTGRFNNAEGTISLDWSVEDTTDWFNPFRWWASIEGSISY